MASSLDILNTAKSEADKLYSQMYNPYLKALTGYSSQLQADQPTLEKDITQGYESLRRNTTAAREAALGQIGTQRTSAQRASESAVAEARRMASEQMQGLQAQYGSSTGTGGFTGELVGRQTAANISAERGNLAGQMETLDTAARQVETDTNAKMYEIDVSGQKAINDARNSLRDQLANINFKKGELEADKAAKRIAAIQDFAKTTASIKAQQEQAKQNLIDQKDMALFNFDIYKKQLTAKATSEGQGQTNWANFFNDVNEIKANKDITDAQKKDMMKKLYPGASDIDINNYLGLGGAGYKPMDISVTSPTLGALNAWQSAYSSDIGTNLRNFLQQAGNTTGQAATQFGKQLTAPLWWGK